MEFVEVDSSLSAASTESEGVSSFPDESSMDEDLDETIWRERPETRDFQILRALLRGIVPGRTEFANQRGPPPPPALLRIEPESPREARSSNMCTPLSRYTESFSSSNTDDLMGYQMLIGAPVFDDWWPPCEEWWLTHNGGHTPWNPYA